MPVRSCLRRLDLRENIWEPRELAHAEPALGCDEKKPWDCTAGQ